MKKLVVGSFIFILLSISSQAHASFLGNTFQKIGILTTQLKSRLGASLFYSNYSSSPKYNPSLKEWIDKSFSPTTVPNDSDTGIVPPVTNTTSITPNIVPSGSDTDSVPPVTKKIPTTPTTPTIPITPKLPISSICEPLSTNVEGDDKVNILFVPANTTEDKLDYYKEKLLKIANDFYLAEPFKSNRKLLNFYFLRNTEIIYKDNNIYYDYILKDKLSKLATQNCPYKITQYITVVDANIQVFSSLGGGISITTIGNNYSVGLIPVTQHEFGHSFAGLADLYPQQERFDGTTTLANLVAPNVDLVGGCSNWCKSNTGPYKDNCNQITDASTCKMYNRESNEYSGSGASCKSGDCCVWLNDNAVDPFFKSRCVDLIGNTNIGQSCLSGTGCYYGANFSGIWRPIENFDTIMSARGTEYDPVSVRTLDLKIKCCYPQKGDTFPSECKSYSEKYPAFKDCGIPPSEIIEPSIPAGTIDPVAPTGITGPVAPAEITKPAGPSFSLRFTNFFSGITNFFTNR